MRRAAAAALLFLAAGCVEPGGGIPPPVETVRFTTDDGIELVGEVRGRGDVGVVLLHMFGVDRTSWRHFAGVLDVQGYTSLSFDFRGYGESEGDPRIDEIWRDTLAAVRFMRERGHDEVVLIGASMGGTAALIVSAREDLASVVTLSAPSSFMGLTIVPEAVELIEEPKLFVAAEGDGLAATAAQQLYSLAPEPKRVEVVEGSDHGVELVGAPPVRNLILEFVEDA